jgi:biopolymer transport protein ExbB
MIPIGLFSVWALAVSLERLFTLRRNRIIPPDFMKGLVAAFGPNGTNVEGALAYCDRMASPLSTIIRTGILKLGRRIEIVEKTVEDAAAGEVGRMRRGIESLAVIGTVSPLLGLLGTVVGMISSFRTAALHGLGRGELLATGIHIALVTTASGLIVAIPSLVAYYFFLGRVETLADEIERVCSEFLDQCHEEPAASATIEDKSPSGEEKSGRGIESAAANLRAAQRP